MIGLLALLAFAQPTEFTLTLPASPETVEGQRLIAARAVEHCRGRYPRLGRYRFTGRERVGADAAPEASFEVRQELICLDSPPGPSLASPSPPPASEDWRPTREDHQFVTALSERYFALVDRGDADQVQLLWTDSERQATPLAERAADLAEFRRVAGAPGRHSVVAVTWYVNPAGASRPGVYAAVDYERRYSGLVLNCGYLVWFRTAPDRYELVREETNRMVRDAADPAPERLAELRRQMRCDGR